VFVFYFVFLFSVLGLCFLFCVSVLGFVFLFCILCFCFAFCDSVFGFCFSVLHFVILFSILCFCFVPIGHRGIVALVSRYVSYRRKMYRCSARISQLYLHLIGLLPIATKQKLRSGSF